MQYVSDFGEGWRDVMTPILEEEFGVEVFNPLYKSDYFNMGVYGEKDHGDELSSLQESEQYDELSRVMSLKVAHPDLRLVDSSAFIIARYLQGVVSVGTLDEAFKAQDQKKPIIWYSNCSKKVMPQWMFHRFDHNLFFNSISPIVEYLRRVNNGDLKAEELRYWCL